MNVLLLPVTSLRMELDYWELVWRIFSDLTVMTLK